MFQDQINQMAEDLLTAMRELPKQSEVGPEQATQNLIGCIAKGLDQAFQLGRQGVSHAKTRDGAYRLMIQRVFSEDEIEAVLRAQGYAAHVLESLVPIARLALKRLVQGIQEGDVRPLQLQFVNSEAAPPDPGPEDDEPEEDDDDDFLAGPPQKRSAAPSLGDDFQPDEDDDEEESQPSAAQRAGNVPYAGDGRGPRHRTRLLVAAEHFGLQKIGTAMNAHPRTVLRLVKSEGTKVPRSKIRRLSEIFKAKDWEGDGWGWDPSNEQELLAAWTAAKS